MVTQQCTTVDSIICGEKEWLHKSASTVDLITCGDKEWLRNSAQWWTWLYAVKEEWLHNSAQRWTWLYVVKKNGYATVYNNGLDYMWWKKCLYNSASTLDLIISGEKEWVHDSAQLWAWLSAVEENGCTAVHSSELACMQWKRMLYNSAQQRTWLYAAKKRMVTPEFTTADLIIYGEK